MLLEALDVQSRRFSIHTPKNKKSLQRQALLKKRRKEPVMAGSSGVPMYKFIILNIIYAFMQCNYRVVNQQMCLQKALSVKIASAIHPVP